MRKRLMLAGIVTAVMLATACNKSTGSVADASVDMPSETSGENLVSTESQETETVTKNDNKETSTAKETTKPSVKDSATTESTKKNTETTTSQETSSARAVVTETTTAQPETTSEAQTEATTSAPTQVETTTEAPTPAPTEAPTTQPETTTEAPTPAPTEAPTPAPTQQETTTEAPTPAPTEAPTTQPETTTEAQTEAPTPAPTEAGPKSDEELLAEITDVHYGTRAEVNGNVYWYSNGWQKSQGAWNGPTLNVIMGDVRNGMETYATENSVLNQLSIESAQYVWSAASEDLGWYDEGYVTHEWTYCWYVQNGRTEDCNWHNH